MSTKKTTATTTTTTLPPVESTPVLLIRFTEKAETNLIRAVKERLEEEGLIIIVETEYDANDDATNPTMAVTTILGISTTQARLEKEAQVIRLLKRRQDTHIMEAFDVEQKHKYGDTSVAYRDSMGLFSSNDWSLLVNRMLEDTTVLPESQLSSKLSQILDALKVPYRLGPPETVTKEGEKKPLLSPDKVSKIFGGMRGSFRTTLPTQSLRHTLEEAGLIDAVAPIHRTAIKDEIWRKTRSLTTIYPPVQLMRQYYGEEIAFYFGWMGFLTQWLIFPGIIGLGAYVYRWYREDTIMTDEYTPFYGIITYFWSVLFLKFWKRHEARLAYQWGVMMGEYEKAKYFAVRPEYYGHVLRKSPVTGQLEAYYPDWRRRCQFLVSALVTLILLNAAFWIMIASLNMQGYINPKYDPGRWSDTSHHPFHWPRLSKLAEEGEIFDMNSTYASLIPVLLHVATIFTFNNIYRVVATRLTKWENHQTQLSFNNSLILKRFLFEAFDCYVALFYLAFYERNIDKLRSELVSVFNIDTIRRLALECIVPMIMQKWNRKRRDPTASSKKTDGPQVATRYTPLADQAELDEYEQFDDFMEIIIQFGYVTLFASAYPLASLISIVANLIEIRSDAFRITYICQRPRSIRCDGLNMWNTLVRGIVRISALTNCLIFGFTSGQLMEWLPHLYQMDDTDHMRFNTDKGWIVIFIIFGLERILLWTGALLDASIPDVPEDVMNQLERKHFVLEEESREYEHQQESKRQKKS